MTTNFLELATTLKYLRAKWLPEKKVNFTPWDHVQSHLINVSLHHSQQWMDGEQVWTDSGQSWMDDGQTHICV